MYPKVNDFVQRVTLSAILLFSQTLLTVFCGVNQYFDFKQFRKSVSIERLKPQAT